MAKLPFLTLTSTVNDLRITTNNLNNLIGDLALLNTAGDSDLVQAINYVDSDTNARIDSADAYFKARIASEVLTLNNRITDVDSDLNARVDSADSYFKTRIASEVATLNTTISNGDSDLNARVDSADSYFKGRIASEVATLNNTISDGDSDLNARVDSADSYFKARIISEVATLNNTINALSVTESDLAIVNARLDSIDSQIITLDGLIDSVSDDLGIIANLNSSNKTSMVAAYNELRARVDLIDSAAAVNIDSAFDSIIVLENRLDSNDTNFVTRVRGSISGGGDITYNPATGVISVDSTQTYTKENFNSDFSDAITADLTFNNITINGTLSTDDVTASTLTASGNVIVQGNLTVNGTTTTVNTETINLADNIILLNSNETSTPSQDAGIEIERGTSTNVSFLWDETNDRWTVGSGTLVAGTFIGNLTGTASVATTMTLVATNTTNATHYPVFVDATTGNENPRTDDGFLYNPSTGTLTATTFSGALSGNATTATTASAATNVEVVANNSTNETVYIAFVDGVSGPQGIETDTGLVYNPSTNTLTATTFLGSLSGNATTATTATVATNVNVIANNTTNETVYLTFVDGVSGSQEIETDTGLVYNPSTNALTATTFSGALSGNATTATTATNVTVTANDTTDETVYLTFVDGATGTQGIETDTSLTYNPSTNTLTAGTVSATDFNSTSDARFKQNIQNLENSIDVVNQIRPVSFDWMNGKKSYGVVAQELEAILPELVSEDANGIKRVSYTPIIALLIDIIKSHEIEIQKLKNK